MIEGSDVGHVDRVNIGKAVRRYIYQYRGKLEASWGSERERGSTCALTGYSSD